MFVNFCDHAWMCGGTYLMNCFNDIAFDTQKKRSGFSHFKKLI